MNYLFIILSFLLSFNVWSGQGNYLPAIRMPSLKNDIDFLFYLNGIQEQWPTIFQEAANFDTNVLQLIKDQQRLLTLLASDPNYISSFKNRQYLDLLITTQKELSVQSMRISTMAVEQWKIELHKALSQISLSPQVSIKERLQELLSKQRDFFEEKAKIDSLREKSNRALQNVWGSDFNEELKKLFKKADFRKKDSGKRTEIAKATIKKMLSQANIDLELKGRLEALLQKDIEDIQAEVLGLEFHPLFINFFRSTIYKTDSVQQKLILLEKELINTIQNNKDLGEEKIKYFTTRLEHTRSAINCHQKLSVLKTELQNTCAENINEIVEKQKILGALYAVLQRGFSDFHNKIDSAEQLARQYLQTLTDDDLAFFADIDAVRDQLFFAPWLHTHVLGVFQSFAQQKRSYQTKVSPGEQVSLQEIQPSVGIFRGLIAGDCASKLSFPYPNDPNERVFVILDSKTNAPKGIISSTNVSIKNNNGDMEDALYVITIAGKKLKAGDIELIFRGLEKMKVSLGVKHIVLPEKKNLPGLINYPSILGVYQQYASLGNNIKIVYKNQGIRKNIEDFKSENNTGIYDKMENNQQGVILHISPDNLDDSALTTVQKERYAQMIESKIMSKEEMILFALQQHAAKRYDIVSAILASLVADRSMAEFSEMIAILDNGGSQPQGQNLPDYLKNAQNLEVLPVELYLLKAQQVLEKLGLDKETISKQQTLFYKGRLNAPDAFAPKHLEQTAKEISLDLKRNQISPRCGWKVIFSNRDTLATSDSFKPVFDKLKKLCKSNDEMIAFQAFSILLKLYPSNTVLDAHERQLLLKLLNFGLELGLDLESLVEIRFRLLSQPGTYKWKERELVDEKIAEVINKSNPGTLLSLAHLLDSLTESNHIKEKILAALRNRKNTEQIYMTNLEYCSPKLSDLKDGDLQAAFLELVDRKNHFSKNNIREMLMILNCNLITNDEKKELINLIEDSSRLLQLFMDFLESGIGDNEEVEKIFLNVFMQNNKVNQIFSSKDLDQYLNIVSLLKNGEIKEYLHEFFQKHIFEQYKNHPNFTNIFALKSLSSYEKEQYAGKLAQVIESYMAENKINSDTWLRFATILSHTNAYGKIQELKEPLGNFGLKIIEQGSYGYTIIELYKYLVDTPVGDFWPEHRALIANKMEAIIREFEVDNFVALYNYWSSCPQSDESKIIVEKLSKNMEEKLSDIDHGWIFVQIAFHYEKDLENDDKKHIKERLKQSLLNVLISNHMQFKIALNHYPNVKQQWLKEIPDLESIVSMDHDEERANYIREKYL